MVVPRAWGAALGEGASAAARAACFRVEVVVPGRRAAAAAATVEAHPLQVVAEVALQILQQQTATNYHTRTSMKICS